MKLWHVSIWTDIPDEPVEYAWFDRYVLRSTYGSNICEVFPKDSFKLCVL